MQPVQLQGTYLDLTTPHVADACMRLGIPVRCAPAGRGPVWSGTHLVGRVCPARHYGSVDVFLEAIEGSDPGAATPNAVPATRRTTTTSPRQQPPRPRSAPPPAVGPSR
jgi:hypothetical protein